MRSVYTRIVCVCVWFHNDDDHRRHQRWVDYWHFGGPWRLDGGRYESADRVCPYMHKTLLRVGIK